MRVKLVPSAKQFDHLCLYTEASLGTQGTVWQRLTIVGCHVEVPRDGDSDGSVALLIIVLLCLFHVK